MDLRWKPNVTVAANIETKVLYRFHCEFSLAKLPSQRSSRIQFFKLD